MENPAELPPALREAMRNKGIDLELTLSILSNYNRGKYDSVEPVRVKELPSVDGSTVLDLTGEIRYRVPRTEAKARLSAIDRSIDPESIGIPDRDDIVFDREALRRLGVLLYPYTAYGVLNGGSATSYADTGKNASFDRALFAFLEPEFTRMAELSGGRAKGVTPAFLNPDGTPGPSFLELKLRALLVRAAEYRAATGRTMPPGTVFFQMTSVRTDRELSEALDSYRESPLLSDLIRSTGIDPTRAAGGIQPLIAAYTHGSEGRPKRVFSRAWGKENEPLPLPGGHGQNFAVLAETYRALYREGKRFAYLGNVDNIGFTVSAVELAMLALSGRGAGFEFSFRTPVDVKGGVLVRDQRGRLNAADIGPAITNDEVRSAEAGGRRALFNCATGLFDLAWLTKNLESITENLPMRWSDQEKDAGNYSQAEQVTWEIIGMMDEFLVFGVDKFERFLAAKLLVETLLTSGTGLGKPGYPRNETLDRDLEPLSRKLHAGLVNRLEEAYGMRLAGGRWEPIPVHELEARYRAG